MNPVGLTSFMNILKRICSLHQTQNAKHVGLARIRQQILAKEDAIPSAFNIKNYNRKEITLYWIHTQYES